MNICLFTEEEIQKPLSLADERAQHIVKVLHKNVGDTFTAGIIGKCSGIATITSVSGTKHDGGSLCFSFKPTGDGKPLYPLVMIIGFPRPIQLKRLLRDMASLGVKEVHLTATELGEKSYLNSDLATSEAGYKMLLDGTVQAGGVHVPLLVRHKSLKECLLYMKEKFPNAKNRLALDNVNSADSLPAFLHTVRDAANSDHKMLTSSSLTIAAIGSERGWTDAERALLESQGYIRLGMGSRILRTETAATTAASLILGAQGFLG